MGAEFKAELIIEYFLKLLPYIKISLIIVGSSILVGLAIGLLIALPRLYKVPIFQRISQVYVSFFRGTPILIQLFLIYYGVPEILKLVKVDVSRIDVLYFVILTYGLHSAAFISEGIRASVSAVDRGQIEAAYSVGMDSYQAFKRIIAPQAFTIWIPILGNLLIGTLKDTSLAFTLGVMELTGQSQTLGLLNRHFIESYLALAIVYFILSVFLEKGFNLLEQRFGKYERTSVEKNEKSFKIRNLFGKMNRDVVVVKESTRL